MLIPDPVLSTAERAFLAAARRGVLATIAPDGRPRLVPICLVLDTARPVLYTPLDEKPKRVSEPSRLARVRDLGLDPRVSVLVDRWDEDWTRLAWLRCHGTASILEPGGEDNGEHGSAVEALRAKYQQYVAHRLETRPLIRIAIERVTSWGAMEPGFDHVPVRRRGDAGIGDHGRGGNNASGPTGAGRGRSRRPSGAGSGSSSSPGGSPRR